MTFTTTSLFIAGLVATGVPIAIHLLSKGKPRKIVFSGLRFAQATLAANRRRVKVKRLALLALRVALFIALGSLLARPVVTSSKSSDLVGEGSAKNGPVAAAIVVDTSPRMGRARKNVALLDQAKGVGRSILAQLPRGSEIAVVDGSASGDAFQADRYAARERLDKLAVVVGGRDAAASTAEGIELVKTSELPLKEVYVLSDQTTGSWPDRNVKRMRRAAEENGENLKLYFVDLGDDAARNVAVVGAEPSAETLSENSSLRVDVALERVDQEGGDVALEILFFRAQDLPNAIDAQELLQQDSLSIYREKQTIHFEQGREKKDAVFYVPKLPVGFCVGVARVVGQDALSFDDARPFVVNVAPDWKILVVAPSPAKEKALFLTQALAPDELRKTGRAPFELDLAAYSPQNGEKNFFELSSKNLEEYRAIFLLDPPALDAEVVAKLDKFANSGGGIALFLGPSAKPIDAFQTSETLNLLGVKPTKLSAAPPYGLILSASNYDEPLLSQFRPFAREGLPWDAAPVAKYWALDELSPSATPIMSFVDDQGGDSGKVPAIVENRVGQGLVVTVATSIVESPTEGAWNALATGDAPWLFILLVDSMARRLASTTSSIYNYGPGEAATLRLELADVPATATIYEPSGAEITTPTDPQRRQIRFPGVKTLGVSRVKTAPNSAGQSVDQVFAVAAPGSESDMTRRSPEEWSKLLEGLPYHTLDLSSTTEELESARESGEDAPYFLLALLLLALFIAETIVSNRFYHSEKAQDVKTA